MPIKLSLTFVNVFLIFLMECGIVDPFNVQLIVLAQFGGLVAVVWTTNTMRITRQAVARRREKIIEARNAEVEAPYEYAKEVWKKTFDCEPDDILIRRFVQD